MQHTFIIPGNPIAKKRPRFATRGNRAMAYSNQDTDESFFVRQLMSQMQTSGITSPITGAVFVRCEFAFGRPKGHYGTGKNSGKLKPSAPALHTQKPDIDNLNKWILDCINRSGFWKDDAQVCSIRSEKRWTRRSPFTTITIETID